MTSTGVLPHANRIFVNREGPQKVFEDAAFEAPAGPSSVLVFYGVGGQGKSWLCRALQKKFQPGGDPSYGHMRAALLDLSGNIPETGELLLIRIRNEFALAGVSTPAFDLAVALLWQRWRSEQALPRLERPWLRRTTAAAQAGRDGLADKAKDWFESDAAGEVIGGLAGSVPGIGPIVKWLGGWAIEKGKRAYLEYTRDHVKDLFVGDEIRPPFEVLKLLPWMLGCDLNYHVERNAGERLVLLVDEYERVFDQGGGGAQWQENGYDALIRSLIASSRGMLVTFFTRERLPWAGEWEARLRNRQHLLRGLQQHDADACLRAVPIAQAELRAAMIDGARETSEPTAAIYPLLLELQIERHRFITAGGRSPRPDDFHVSASGFEDRRRDLVGRVLRDYGLPLQVTLERLCWCRRFDKAIFRHVVQAFMTGLPVDHYERLADLSIISPGEDGYLRMHQAIAEIIGGMQPVNRRYETLIVLHNVFRERAEVRPPAPFGQPQLAALLEAAHYGAALPETQFLDWIRHTCAPMRRYGHLSAGLELWRQIRLRLLADLGAADHRTCFAGVTQAQFMAALGDVEGADRVIEDVKGHGYRLSSGAVAMFVSFAPTLAVATRWLDVATARLPAQPSQGEKNDYAGTFAKWLRHVEVFDVARTAVADLRKKHILPTDRIYARLLRLTRSFEQSYTMLAQMRADRVKPNPVHYAILLDLADTPEQTARVRTRMQAEGIKINIVHYNTMLKGAGNIDKAGKILSEMLEQGLSPDIITYTTLMKLAPSREIRLEYYDRIFAEALQPNERTFGVLIKAETTFDEALRWFDVMRRHDVRPNRYHVMDMAKTVTSREDIDRLLAQLRIEEIRPDSGLFSQLSHGLMKNAAEGAWEADARLIFDTMREAHVEPTVSVYNAQLQSVPDAATALRVVAQMRSRGLQPDQATFLSVVSKSRTREECEAVLDRMRAEDVPVSTAVLNRVMQLQADLAGGVDVLERMRALDLTPNTSTYATLAGLSPDLETALDWVRRSVEQGLPAGEDITSTLSRNVATYAEAQRATTVLRGLGVQLGPSFFAGLAKRLATVADADELMGWRDRECPALLEPLAAAIKTYSDEKRVEAACGVAVRHPELDAAQALFRKHAPEVRSLLEDRFALADDEFGPARALGFWALANKDPDEALSWFERARDHAPSPEEGAEIDRLVARLEEDRRREDGADY